MSQLGVETLPGASLAPTVVSKAGSGSGTVTSSPAGINCKQLIPSLLLPNYTDPTIVAGQTVSKAANVQELRNAVRAVL